ncbi:MAG: peptidylprolyl isomerase [Dehalococcoidia bacterium]
MIGGLTAGTLPFAGTGGTQRTQDVERPTPRPEETPSPGVPYKDGPKQVLNSGKQYEAVLKTDKGEIRIEMFADQAPEAVNSFVFLAQEGFYNGLEFFFVRQGFVAQTGDPTCDASGIGTCTGTGSPYPSDFGLPLEANDQSHVRGAVVLPATIEGEKVHGSQFRILLADDSSRLDGKETVFGRVVEGLDVLEGVGDIVPCFGTEPSESNPCEVDPAKGLVIEDVAIKAT